MCGCGEETSLAQKTQASKGWIKGRPVRYIWGHHRRGGKFPTGKTPHNYGGGVWRNGSNGRWVVSCRDGSRVMYYRAVMEAHLGRHLHRDEVVHHINGDPADDRLENLELWSTSHPPGSRVEDQIAWAKEILARYEEGINV